MANLDTNGLIALETLESNSYYEKLISQPDYFIKRFSNICDTYLSIFEDFLILSEPDLKDLSTRIDSALKAQNVSNSASRNTAPKLHKLLGERRTKLFDHIKTIFADPETFKQAAKRTATDMLNSYILEVETAGKNPKPGITHYNFFDGDPKSDAVRWTYLYVVPNQGLPDTYIHYFAAHLIDFIAVNWMQENVSAAELVEQGLDANKDNVLTIFSDLLSLNSTRDTLTDSQQDALNYWSTPRVNGGLGWIKQEFLNCFKDDL